MKTYRGLIIRGKFVTTGEGVIITLKARSEKHARRMLEETIKESPEFVWDKHMTVGISEEVRAEIDVIEEGEDDDDE